MRSKPGIFTVPSFLVLICGSQAPQGEGKTPVQGKKKPLGMLLFSFNVYAAERKGQNASAAAPD